MDKLFSICDGWTSCDGMIVSPDPKGGIIDRNAADLGWFVVFNDNRPSSDFFNTLDEAIDFFYNSEST